MTIIISTMAIVPFVALLTYLFIDKKLSRLLDKKIIFMVSTTIIFLVVFIGLIAIFIAYSIKLDSWPIYILGIPIGLFVGSSVSIGVVRARKINENFRKQNEFWKK